MACVPHACICAAASQLPAVPASGLRGRPLPIETRARTGGRGPTVCPALCVRAASESPSPQEDLFYLLKFGAASLAGAGLIKYGSVLFPDVTTPNFSLALLLIWSPVVASVVFLAVASVRGNGAT